MSIYITGDVHGDFSELQQWCCAMESKKSNNPSVVSRKNKVLFTLMLIFLEI